jgi:prolyl-tRNA editing enzyme YbaK/EbsC (Cys-tRNA(Pro) deacylase)
MDRQQMIADAGPDVLMPEPAEDLGVVYGPLTGVWLSEYSFPSSSRQQIYTSPCHAGPVRKDAVWLDDSMTVQLAFAPALSRLDLLAPAVAAALRDFPGADEVEVAEIDPALADTAAFCARYGVTLEESANCVVIAAKRGGETRHAACMVAATTRADVNGLVRRHLDARKASFAPVAEVTAATGMEYGGITPVGLPAGWPVLVDETVAKTAAVVIGSGIRGSKLRLPGPLLAALPAAQVLPGLGIPVAP